MAEFLQHGGCTPTTSGSSSTTGCVAIARGASKRQRSKPGSHLCPRQLRLPGATISTTVPTPSWLDSSSAPPDCSAKPCTMDKPRPVPLPRPLVVKNGQPHVREPPRPYLFHCRRQRGQHAPQRVLPPVDGLMKLLSVERATVALRAARRSRPPPGMASRALAARLSSESSSWFGSA